MAHKDKLRLPQKRPRTLVGVESPDDGEIFETGDASDFAGEIGYDDESWPEDDWSGSDWRTTERSESDWTEYMWVEGTWMENDGRDLPTGAKSRTARAPRHE